MVGDIVEITPLKHNFGVIEKLYERKNKLIRLATSFFDYRDSAASSPI